MLAQGDPAGQLRGQGPGGEPGEVVEEVLDAGGGQQQRHQLRQRVNGGTYRARDTALAQARGTWFTTLDSDDWLHPQTVATLVRTVEADPAVHRDVTAHRRDEDIDLRDRREGAVPVAGSHAEEPRYTMEEWRRMESERRSSTR